MGRTMQPMPDVLDPVAAATAWRPQRYGRRAPHEIPDPLVEPLWTGPRVLVAATPDGATIVHDGEEVVGLPALRAALPGTIRADGLVLEGVLSQQALGTGEGAYTAPDGVSFNPLKMLGRLFVPGMGRRDRLLREREEAREQETARKKLLAQAFGDEVALVATDLLWLDGDELLDVPLLERKRLLESALDEAELVRRTAFVRPSASGSLIAWKALGFAMLAYKGAGSRYTPGELNHAWTTAPAPSTVAPPQSRAAT